MIIMVTIYNQTLFHCYLPHATLTLFSREILHGLWYEKNMSLWYQNLQKLGKKLSKCISSGAKHRFAAMLCKTKWLHDYSNWNEADITTFVRAHKKKYIGGLYIFSNEMLTYVGPTYMRNRTKQNKQTKRSNKLILCKFICVYWNNRLKWCLCFAILEVVAGCEKFVAALAWTSTYHLHRNLWANR